MLICAAGDTHGELVKLYECVASLEAEVGRRRNHLQGSARRHYCEADLRRLRDQSTGGVDILMLHEPPAGSLTELERAVEVEGRGGRRRSRSRSNVSAMWRSRTFHDSALRAPACAAP